MTHDSTAEIDALVAAIAARPQRWPTGTLPRAVGGVPGEAGGGGEGRWQAAVCVPLHYGPQGLEIWAIKRQDGMRHHASEMAFPGGKPDRDDRDLVDTALREMDEELGIARGQVRLLGALAPVPTATSRFTLNPFVVLVSEAAVARPHPGEVAVLIRMVVADFFAGRVPFRAVALAAGRTSPIFDFEVGSMYGASAHILEETLRAYADVHGLRLPEPTLTNEIPWL